MDQVSFSTQPGSGLNRQKIDLPKNDVTSVVHTVAGHLTCLISFLGEPTDTVDYVLRDCTSEDDSGFEIAAATLTLSSSPDDGSKGIAHFQVPAWAGTHLRLVVTTGAGVEASLEIVSH